MATITQNESSRNVANFLSVKNGPLTPGVRTHKKKRDTLALANIAAAIISTLIGWRAWWWPMVADGGRWWPMVADGGRWWLASLVVADGGRWWPMVADGGRWWPMVAGEPGGGWRAWWWLVRRFVALPRGRAVVVF